ncbi:LDH2 family malate/lactate/ureidoglycolate dehydrogenase [Stella humosa]|uniref:LDH2 family malate/lactate/ureidoglycolate dehydrogenase n=1 Tax=Stella humosa TaxID=94 RepID=A0A3N1KRX4_9PROT|nr:Ldh family oxidoreductase [Stella humosa]ROP81140.1 LDH2 family malate/lactate/ureidoglycolate dehydrogenase [Stella humosa]BBK32485.1 malate dehydrogenase [Stella humosa]
MAAVTTRIPAERLRRQLALVFDAWGMPDDQAAAVIDVMVETDLRGVDSHGVSMLPLYDKLRREGKVLAAPEVKVTREAPVTALVDAGHGLGHYAAVRGMSIAIEKAKASGMAAVGVFNSNHYGPAGYYALMAAQAGLIGMSFTNVWNSAVVPTRSRVPMFGTNPIAFAAPAGHNPPFCLDMATSTVAIGKLRVAYLNEKPVPAGWAMDEAGQPLTDATAALESRHLTPLGGLAEMSSHKGYGLGAMVEILCAMLTGAWYAPVKAKKAPDDPMFNIGHFFFAIDPKAFRDPGEFEADLDGMIDALRAAEPAEAGKPVLVHGDPELANHAERTANGIPMPPALLDEVRDVARLNNVAFVLDGQV